MTALLMETVADIAYMAGVVRYDSGAGDSRFDISQFIKWAEEFEAMLQVDEQGNETYGGDDYLTAVEKFAKSKIAPMRSHRPTFNLIPSFEPEFTITMSGEMLDIILSALQRANFREIEIGLELGVPPNTGFEWLRKKLQDVKGEE